MAVNEKEGVRARFVGSCKYHDGRFVLSFHLENHRCNLSRAGWMVTSASDGCLQEATMVTSSAKSRILAGGGILGRSVSIILNRVGLSTAP